MPEPSPAQWARQPRFPLSGVAVNVRSVFNVGAMFRASDAARVEQLYLTGGTASPSRDRERIDKTALGAVASVPWTWSAEPESVLGGLAARGVCLVALELAPRAVTLADLTVEQFPLALVVGHETDGLPPHVLALCHHSVCLESYGRKSSLNVATAYGVGVLHCARLWANRASG